ncbi:TrkH family potassium uptake protein [Sansalvadorimonas sp. 2012CJ34-2]|uniref:Trk system potassium uptake protein n=1 Tax=Parendozoicomonas callyspongiae TaxID=2942213 RepID=A0ABT0PBX6_9GAMM|nr:TrkH family potassium uptake protein [Sansalvadorimonas sp. 2012CJ34-2]MCL6268541.1 TrkH family potassium uptake protein [Sansalvadorimonas sp. 2012CJ34-2]
MHPSVILRILGALLVLFSLASLPPVFVAWLYHEPEIALFSYTFVVTLFTGLGAWLPFAHTEHELRPRDGFLITVLFWLVLSLFGSIPLLLMETPNLDFTDAFFESMSGLTTTGATVITGLEELPKSILFYRQQLQWLGGMGIIVLAVAILPMLGIGGMQLYRTEAPGPIKDRKLTPRIAETAKTLWYLYLGITTICAGCYWLAGMNLFDAICHSFSTVAIGGFSTYDASIGWFNSPLIEGIAIFFMVISGMNFALHYFAIQSRDPFYYFRDPEVQGYLAILAGVGFISVVALDMTGTYTDWEALRYGVFEVVSIATTTGYSISDFSLWPIFLPMLLFLTSFSGACAGSTGGGMKVIRILLIFKQASRELKRLIHPNAIFTVKLGRRAVPDRVGEAVWGFVSAYIFLFIIMELALLATGLDLTTAFSTVASCLNNLGPALGEASANYQSLPATAKWVLSFAMLLGRLEIFTLVVLFSPMFWRH